MTVSGEEQAANIMVIYHCEIKRRRCPKHLRQLSKMVDALPPLDSRRYPLVTSVGLVRMLNSLRRCIQYLYFRRLPCQGVDLALPVALRGH